MDASEREAGLRPGDPPLLRRAGRALKSFRHRVPAAWRILWNRDDQRVYWSDGSWSYRSHVAGLPPTPREGFECGNALDFESCDKPCCEG